VPAKGSHSFHSLFLSQTFDTSSGLLTSSEMTQIIAAFART
jgi:hypothetical protein